MDNISILVAACVSALSVLGLVIRTLLSDRKQQPTNGNGNGAKQSRECWEQHQTVLAKLDSVERDIELLQKTMDSRTPLFRIVEEKLNDLNLSVSRWDGSDRRQS